MDWSEEMNPTERPYVLHGFDVSYFTAKARVGMRYKRLFMEEKRAESEADEETATEPTQGLRNTAARSQFMS